MDRMKFEFILLWVLIFLSFTSAICSNEQIDINSASLEELDELDGIGLTYAQRVIDARPFNSVDELEPKVSGIGEVTLQKIKDQGLACISDDDDNVDLEEDDDEIDPKPNIDYERSPKDRSQDDEGVVIMKLNNSPKTVINLESSDDVRQNKEVIYESKNERIKKFSSYAFFVFLILIIAYLFFS
jgi:competence ComEA-like helix-hairpin-helix protein